MGKVSKVEIPGGSGNFYRYTYEDGQTRYLGPVGDAPEMSEESFLTAMNIPKPLKFTEKQEELFKAVVWRGQHPFNRYAHIETGGQYNMLTVRSLRDKGLVEVSEARGATWEPEKRLVLTGPLIAKDDFFLMLTKKGVQYAKAHNYWDWTRAVE